jgi:hypothetical protein
MDRIDRTESLSVGARDFFSRLILSILSIDVRNVVSGQALSCRSAHLSIDIIILPIARTLSRRPRSRCLWRSLWTGVQEREAQPARLFIRFIRVRHPLTARLGIHWRGAAGERSGKPSFRPRSE